MQEGEEDKEDIEVVEGERRDPRATIFSEASNLGRKVRT
jgi:hypothetical protein